MSPVINMLKASSTPQPAKSPREELKFAGEDSPAREAVIAATASALSLPKIRKVNGGSFIDGNSNSSNLLI